MNLYEHITERSIAHVTRFNNKPQHFKESVAEHSFFVAYITCLLCDVLKERGETIDKEKAITMALIHDMEESFSGDIIGPFKHHSYEVNEAIKKVNKEVIRDIFEDVPAPLSSHYINLWNEEGDGKTTEAQVVKKADKIALVAKCQEEVRAGNAFFKETHDRELNKLYSDGPAWWDAVKHVFLPKKD